MTTKREHGNCKRGIVVAIGGFTARRAGRNTLAVAAMALLLTDLAAFRSVANHARPVSLSHVVARFRKSADATSSRALAPAAQPPLASSSSSSSSTAAPAGAVLASVASKPGAASTNAAAAGVRPLAAPAPGVYLYRTTGHEETNAVGGAHHSYPAQTTITVTPSPCGFTMRWDALEQRFDQWSMCTSGRQLPVITEVMKHAFYGVNDQRTYQCQQAAFRPGPEVPNTPITGRCAGSGDSAVWSGKVVGLETVTVAGKAVAAIHVVMDEHVSGATDGTRHSENWFAIDSGLLLKRIASVVGDSSTAVGRAHYTEAVTLDLVSMTPQQ
jgi:hypothetical protein